MADSILDRIHSRSIELERKPIDAEGETDDIGSFGILRGIKERSIMLELRMKTGLVTALSYSWLEQAEYNPDTGIVLKFGNRKVHVIGSGLNSEIRPNVSLFTGLIRHRVTFIKESGMNDALRLPKTIINVESLRIE